jgi:hypothetical protein
MTQVEKIKTEIERMKSSLPWGSCSSQMSMECNCKNEAYNEVLSYIDSLEEEPISNDLEEACDEYYNETWDEHGGKAMVVDGCHDIWFPSQATDDFFKAGAQWQKENLWKDAQGDDLPEIDKDVIVLVKALPEHEDSLLKVAFAHRPPKYWEGKSIGTGEITRYEPMRYDKGQWSKPAVVWWLDVELPKEEE